MFNNLCDNIEIFMIIELFKLCYFEKDFLMMVLFFEEVCRVLLFVN